MPDRRSHSRPDSGDRRTFPRPPLWLNLALIVLAVATFAWAQHHRTQVEEKSALLFQKNPNTPAELNRIRAELSEMDVTQEQLRKELDGRVQYLNELKGEQFYVAIDRTKNKFYFRFGPEIAREADVQVGPSLDVKDSGGKQWTFVPLKGAVNVTSKEQNHAWRVPAWVYAMNKQPVPTERPVIPDGLGKYVIFLPNGYVIHSQPSADSPLRGAKPGSFMVPEGDLAAIWPRISTNTRVYVF